VCCLGHPLDAREALVPSRRNARHLSLGLSEALVAYGEACFAADALCVHELGTLQDKEVLGDALSRDGKLAGERARRCFAALEQKVEQSEPHWIPERCPQALGVLAVACHRVSREAVMRAA
jgi:hypothetical protein